jgi:predicted nucleic-acid-binding Zn-ribbon protein
MSAFDPGRMGYRCPKCGNSRFETGQLRATGGFWSKIFDVQHRKFTTVTCDRCKYTEMYKADSSALGNIFDFITSG